MNTTGFAAHRVASPLDWLRVRRLYGRAFPASERKPFAMIVRMQRKGRTDVWCFTQDRRFAGFAATINDSDAVLIDYLAVPDGLRGKGVGSRALDELKRQYPGRGLFVEIESAYEHTADTAERLRRKRFYMRNGMQPMNVMADVFGVKMELLTWNCRVDFARYHAFYRDNIGEMAAQHILEAVHPEGIPER